MKMNANNLKEEENHVEDDSSVQENKRTVGEELFLVHLKRKAPKDEEEDYDEEPPIERKRKSSIGEELYQVHLKRSCHDLQCETDTNVPKCEDENKEECSENNPNRGEKTNWRHIPFWEGYLIYSTLAHTHDGSPDTSIHIL